MELHETVDMATELWDYVELKFGKDRAAILITKWGLDNPHMLRTRSLDEWKKIIDKLVLVNTMRGD